MAAKRTCDTSRCRLFSAFLFYSYLCVSAPFLIIRPLFTLHSHNHLSTPSHRIAFISFPPLFYACPLPHFISRPSLCTVLPGAGSRCVVSLNMHGPFLPLLLLSRWRQRPFSSAQTMGSVVTESTVVMSHLPPRAISLSCPQSLPSRPLPTLHTRCPLFNSTLILLQERKTWEPSIRPKASGATAIYILLA